MGDETEIEPRGHSQHHDGAENPFQRPGASEANDQRGDQIELLLDGERPEMAKPGAGKAGQVHAEGVLQEQKIGNHGKGQRRMNAGVGEASDLSTSKTDENDIKKNPGVVHRDDAKNTAGVKSLEVVGRLAGIHENAANEEAGEHKEKIEGGPIQCHKALQPGKERAGWQFAFLINGVEGQNHDQSEPPQTIQFGEALLGERRGHSNNGKVTACRGNGQESGSRRKKESARSGNLAVASRPLRPTVCIWATLRSP